MVRRVALAVAVVATLLVAACTTPATPATGLTPPSGTPSAGTALDWAPCQSEALKVSGNFPHNLQATCATVTVPADWRTAKDGKPSDGKTFGIALVKIHATADTHPKGAVLTNPGGPGGSGFDFAIQVAGRMTDLLANFDLIGFDPRGVKRSNPVKCFSDSDLDAYYDYDPDPVSDASYQGLVGLDQRMDDACTSKYGKDLALFSTEQSARDIDAIRIGLGEDKINYLGFSYGTLLGATYAQLFPTKIRAMTLDGAVDPTESFQDAAEGQAKGFERAFTDFTAWCKAHPVDCPISADPHKAVVDAINTARTKPVTGADGRKASPGLVFLAVTASLYSEDAWSAMAQSIADLKTGDSRILFLLADSYSERDDNGTYSNTTDAFNTVECTDGTAPTVDQDRALQAQWRAKYPLFGASLATGMLNCSEWSGPKDPFPTGPAKGAPPIIVVGTTGDPATPYESTAKLASMLGVGTVLTWDGEGHTAYLSSDCIRSAVNKYFVDLTVPSPGTTCPAQ